PAPPPPTTITSKICSCRSVTSIDLDVGRLDHGIPFGGFSLVALHGFGTRSTQRGHSHATPAFDQVGLLEHSVELGVELLDDGCRHATGCGNGVPGHRGVAGHP